MQQVYKSFPEKQAPVPDEILNGCRKGDSRSQEALYKKYSRLMFAVCIRYTDNRQSAEDLLQEGFIKVFHAIHDFREDGSLEGWIRKIMVRTALEHFRKKVNFFPLSPIEKAAGSQMDEQILSNMASTEIMDAMNGLSPGYKTVLNLYCVEGYSHKEIADLLGITEGTSKSQLSRAREIMKDLLKDYQTDRRENA